MSSFCNTLLDCDYEPIEHVGKKMKISSTANLPTTKIVGETEPRDFRLFSFDMEIEDKPYRKRKIDSNEFCVRNVTFMEIEKQNFVKNKVSKVDNNDHFNFENFDKLGYMNLQESEEYLFGVNARILDNDDYIEGVEYDMDDLVYDFENMQIGEEDVVVVKYDDNL